MLHYFSPMYYYYLNYYQLNHSVTLKFDSYIIQKMRRNNDKVKSNTSLQKQKRLIFAQEIRRRDRFEKMSQIREDFNMRENMWELLHKENFDAFELYAFLRNSKINEANGAYTIAQWLNKYNPSIQIHDWKENLYWGYILSTVIQYKNQLTHLIITSYLPPLVKFNQQAHDFEIVFTILSAIVRNNTQLSSQEQVFLSQNITNIVSRALEQLPNCEIGINQLKFYTYCFNSFPSILEQLSHNNNFLIKLIQILAGPIEKTNQINNAIKILAFMTYYDEKQSQFEGVVIKLLQLKLLDTMKFFLNFLDPKQNKSLLYNTLLFLGNIFSTFGIQILFKQHLLQLILNLYTTDVNPEQIRIQAGILYMNIILQVRPYSQQLASIRRNNYEDSSDSPDPIATILHIIQQYGQNHKQIIDSSKDALQNLLYIGQQEKIKQQLDINPYALKLSYEYNWVILNKYEEFAQLLSYYEIH